MPCATGRNRSKGLLPPLQSPRLLAQMRERLRYLHYSLRTEKSYLYWVRWFIRFHGLRHPRGMGKPEVEAFLTMLATERQVAVSTHRQALSALLFLYKEVLGEELPWMQEIGRPTAAGGFRVCSRFRRCSGCCNSWKDRQACWRGCSTAPACA